MKRITDWTEIRQNLIQLDKYRTSSNEADQEYFRDRIRMGNCYVVCTVRGGRRLFGPSRFLGYANNTRWKHDHNEEKHGGITTGWIESTMKAKFRGSSRLEAEFRQFCKEHGIEPSGKSRRYLDHKEPVEETQLEAIQADIASIPTSEPQLIDARKGQGKFRSSLEKMWRGRCALTGCTALTLLKASHIKPWRDCTDKERLDRFNGLLLVPNVDAAFDRGLVSIDAKGHLMISGKLSSADRKTLGLRRQKVAGLKPQHHAYLAHHRKELFIK